MIHTRKQLELLAPAKNADIGIEAINHGADAIYIGGPAFGARANAENTVADIERLARHAHRFGARVFVTCNTILFDEEVAAAERLIRQLHEAGADALIVQDMGILELDLPPIQLHASTQTDIRHPEKARFLQDVGFSQIVLAREMTLTEIRKVAAATDCTLEFFIHGALCVAFSGQCYISHAHTGRSANRGECSQACRLPYDLTDKDGNLVASNQHLLSMKDNNQSANLRALADAGISSFKIEGRYKDMAYVKNITAHYRLLLDEIMADTPEYSRTSAGRSTFLFQPLADKTFNRGATDYFVNGRTADIGAFDSPKFVGEPVGSVIRVDGKQRRHFDLTSAVELHNGDGLSFYDRKGELVGLRVNRAEKIGEDFRVHTADAVPAELFPGSGVFRNHDHEFERMLEKKSAERRIAVDVLLTETPDGFALTLTDETGSSARAELPHGKEPAKDAERALAGLRDSVAKLGATIFSARDVQVQLTQAWFLPAGVVNALRRDAADKLEAARIDALPPLPRRAAVEPPVPYPETELSYLANVLNQKARDFYHRHGVQLIEAAYEANEHTDDASLMITKHCLRYSFNLCPKEVKGIKPDPMTLINGKEQLTLKFDCKRCEMHVIGRIRKSVLDMPAVPIQFHASRPATFQAPH
ncbi:protease [Zoogloea ramigera]|uniref:Protease n=1 Tax=Zoogloea ramigera TaxID=350 RepID=A0A4Y4CVC0_ZOORA|nr:U32 family peptidase [Zoogloea ramigera]MBP7625987.1 U32 family peptidase [Zoogloea sp.]GEC96062.1 protease [Zoogloea ramigera]